MIGKCDSPSRLARRFELCSSTNSSPWKPMTIRTTRRTPARTERQPIDIGPDMGEDPSESTNLFAVAQDPHVQFLRVFRAGARLEVLTLGSRFSVPSARPCRPTSHRGAAIPLTYKFTSVTGLEGAQDSHTRRHRSWHQLQVFRDTS